MRISDWSSDVCSSDLQVSADDLQNPEKMAAFQAAQNELGQSLGRLLVSVEAYPQLKSNENFLTLQSQLEGTENRIAVARRDYNEAVRAYNTRIRTFPEMVGAKLVHGAPSSEGRRVGKEGVSKCR